MKQKPTPQTSTVISRWLPCAVVTLAVSLVGCLQSGLERADSLGLYQTSSIQFAAYNPSQSKIDSGKSIQQRLNELANGSVAGQSDGLSQRTTVLAQSPQPQDNSFSGFGFPTGSRSLLNNSADAGQQRPTNNSPGPYSNRAATATPPSQSSLAGRVAQRLQQQGNATTSPTQRADRIGGEATGNVASAELNQSSQSGDAKVKQVAALQYPELATPDRLTAPGNGIAAPHLGGPNEVNSLIQPFERGGNAPIPFPANYADLDVYVAETETGRINLGGAFNSDNGIVGQFSIDEKNFDITRLPRSFRDLVDGTAFRGGGQRFRLDLAPGRVVQRYSVSLTEPYLFGTDYSLSVSGFLFDRRFFDWDEQRLGGRVAIGRRLSPDLSVSFGLRGEDVTIENPRTDDSPTLNADLGSSNLFVANVGLIRDTRDSQSAATQGTFFSATLSQAFGDHDYTRGDFDFRTYKLLRERPDGSGRHTLSYGTKLGFSGSGTPVFENYIAGGFATFRGFDFRGLGPSEGGIRVGGEFQWLNTVEYQFPITADDSIKGVLFCDFGTVEESIEIQSDNFRAAPGFGFRVNIPGAGVGAPLAFDFAFPVATAEGDEEQVFSFYLGLAR